MCLNRGQSISDLGRYNLSNRISSAIIPTGYSVTVWDLWNFGGEAQILSGAIPDLGMYGRDWDNTISSISFNF